MSDAPEMIRVMPGMEIAGEADWEGGGEWFADEPPSEWGARCRYYRLTESMEDRVVEAIKASALLARVLPAIQDQVARELADKVLKAAFDAP